ncbi:MAG: hypothetical protein HUU29_11415 [Planctomycetaceae bacterium]|nr:hypothetical protein [Planctomycetaceae bacterium]
MVQPRKSKTGLFIGIGAGVAVLLIVVVIIATSGPGTSPEEEALIQETVNWNQESSSNFDDAKIAKAEQLSNKVPKELKSKYDNNLGLIKRKKSADEQNERTLKGRAQIEAARKEIEACAMKFYKALKAGDVSAMASLIDAGRYHRNVKGEGGKDGRNKPWPAPSTWKGECYLDAADKQYKWRQIAPFSESELVTTGLEYLKQYYSKESLIIEPKQQDDGTMAVMGQPPASAKNLDDANQYYLGEVTFKVKGVKDLVVQIRGLWGGPAKVDMILDPTEKDYVTKWGTAESQKERESQPPEENNNSSNNTPPTDETPENPPEEHLTPEIPELPAPPTWDEKAKAADTNARALIGPENLRKAMDQLLVGYSVPEFLKDLKGASDRDKLNVIGACVDILNNAARQGANKAAEVMPNISSFIVGGLVEWSYADGSGDKRLSQAWIDALTWNRGISTADGMAWYYRQAYDALKKQIEAEEAVLKK